MTGIFFLILGPSGVGKGTFLSEVKQKWETDDRFLFPVTSTTRNKREGEVDGKDYNFMEKLEFEKGLENNDFLEHAIVHGEHYYGLPKQQVFEALEKGQHVIRELDIQGLWNLQKILPKENLFSIFILPPNMRTLEQRIRDRSPLPEEEIERRLITAQKEITHSSECDRVIVSRDGKINEGVIELRNIIVTEIEKKKN